MLRRSRRKGDVDEKKTSLVLERSGKSVAVAVDTSVAVVRKLSVSVQVEDISVKHRVSWVTVWDLSSATGCVNFWGKNTILADVTIFKYSQQSTHQ